MNESKKFKQPKRRIASVDGILPDGRQLGVPTNRSYRPNRGGPSPSLDGFLKREDGFHPMRQSPHGVGEQPMVGARANFTEDEPIVLDDTPEVKGKRRWFGLRKAKKPAKHSKHPRLRTNLKRTGIGLASLVLVIGAYFAFKVYITERHILKGGGKAPALAENVDISKLKGEGDGRINILLLGIGGPGHDGPDLTDTILIASIDPINHTTALLSIPRDLWVQIPGYGSQKINAAYAYGKQNSKSKDPTQEERDGLALLDKTLSPVLGIPIHYHVIVDFQAFKQAVNTVGGITFNVPEQLYDPTIAWENHGNSVIAKAGVQTMQGDQALLYARSRETSSDFARGERQRLLIVALKDKIFTLGTFGNPVKVSQLLTSFGNNVYTDFALGDLMRLYQIFNQIPSASISSLDLDTPPHQLVTTGNINGLSVVEPRAGLYDYDEITNFIRNNIKDSFLASENATVAIYNATSTPGLATTKSTLLKSYGYNVTDVGNATTTNPPKTTLVDLSKGTKKYTRHYLEERFGVTAVTSLPANSGITPGTANFVIILGQDATTSTSG